MFATCHKDAGQFILTSYVKTQVFSIEKRSSTWPAIWEVKEATWPNDVRIFQYLPFHSCL